MPAFFSRRMLVSCLLVASTAIVSRIHAQETDKPGQPPYSFEKDEDGNSIVRQRMDWFYQQRAFPHEKIPTGARLGALRELDRKLAAEQLDRLAGRLTATPPKWKFIGPQPIDTPYSFPVVAGRVSAITIDPVNPATMYLGAADGGVWKTTNTGASWTELTDTQNSLAVGSIAIDPTNHEIVYVGTGEENFGGDNYFGAGIMKSTNGGATWTTTCGPFCGPVYSDGYYGGGSRIGTLAIDPNNSSVLLVAAVQLLWKDGIYRSSDGGTTWTQVLSGNPGTGLMFDPANGNIAYAALGASFSGGTEGVYKSTDAGVTWTPASGTGSTGIPVASAGRIALAMAHSNPNVLYAGVENISTSGLLGLYKTTNGGVTWTALTNTPDYCTPQCWYDNAIGVQPTNPNVVYAGGAFGTTLVRSLDGGSTWATLESAQNFGFMHADVHAITFTPDGSQLFVGSDGGAYHSTQPTANTPVFTALNSTLGITQFYAGLAIHPTNPAIALGGTQDNGSLLYTGNLTWNQVTCGDGGFSAIDPVVPATMYTACDGITILKSTSGGASVNSWVDSISGIDTGDRAQFIPPLVLDPSSHERLYFGTYRIYQTTNGASSWAEISPDLTSGGTVTTIAVAPSNSNTIYTGSSDSQVFVTTNAGSGASSAWKNITVGLPPRAITQVAVSPTTPKTAYVTFSGFTGFGDSLGHVFKTTNGGTSWADISGNLPNTPVNAIAIDPDLPTYLFVGTDVGVFYSANGGASWNTLVDGLPRVVVMGLTVHEPSYTLRAATHGRGIWDMNLTTLLPLVTLGSISPASATAGSAALTLTVTGTNFNSSSQVLWNGVALTTKFVSATTLTATVPVADLATAGKPTVAVLNTAAPSQRSHAIDFVVNNPAPKITSISPASAKAGAAALTLTVTGTGFEAKSAVEWNGAALTTKFVSATKLTATLPLTDLVTAGTAKVTVVNATPGGGTSNAEIFTISAAAAHEAPHQAAGTRSAP